MRPSESATQGRCRGAPVRLGCVVAVLLAAATLRAETGYDLWLRYHAVEKATLRDSYWRVFQHIRLPADSGVSEVLREELVRSAHGMLDATPKFVAAGDDSITLFIGTTQESG